MASSPEPAADGPPKDNVYERWYKKLSKFYQRLPTVYNKDSLTPSLPFNNLATVERRCFGAKKGKDVGEFLNATIHGIDGYVEEAKKIEYKEILHSKEVTTGKRVIISGAPGCGKTTLARKFSQDLYSQALLNRYEIILLVELRKLKTSLKEMKEDIDLQFLLRKAGVSNLPQLCETMEESDGEGVAMILDGFDEVADYLGESPFLRNLLSVEEPYLSECDVLVTTRPSRCPDLMSLMRQPSRHVEILGFTNSDIDMYVQNSFRKANIDKSEAEQKSKVVIDKLNSLPVIRGMSRIPLVLKIICKVQDHLGSAPLPETVSGIFSLYICHQLVDYLVWASQCTGAPIISDVLKIPTDLFPGFYPLCEIAYKCCCDKKGQRLILTEEDVKEVKEHIDKRGSIYNLLFSERVDETSPVPGFVYQFNHKSVQETLAAIHIADQREEDQQRIWSEDFACPEMAEVWKIYCGLTGLRFVDLSALSQSSLSQRARDAGVYVEDDDKLVMVSLFEGGNRSLSVRIFPTLIGKSLSFSLKSPYDAHVLQSTLRDHPSLEELVLFGDDSHPVGVESLTSSISQHQSLRKLKLLYSFHQSDFEEFGRNLKVCHNLKSITLRDAPVNTVLAVVASGIEELVLEVFRKEVGYNHEEWRALQDTLDASRSLMSFHIIIYNRKIHLPSSSIEHLSFNKTLVNLNIFSLDEYSKLPLSCLRSLLGPREKCHIWMPLTRQQWCAVLSGLKEAKALKELNVDMELHFDSSHDYEGDHSQILSASELEELVATSEQLVKVDVACWKEELSDLMLAIVKGVVRNQNVSQLGIKCYDVRRDSRGTFPSLVETLAHAHHIPHLKWSKDGSLAAVLGPNWCQLVIDGLMCRRVCHLNLWLSVAECGAILSRVHQAEQLEEFSLELCINEYDDSDDRGIDDDDIDDDVVKRVEDVWSMCTLKKVKLSTKYYRRIPPPWYKLLGAVLRGVNVNKNDVNFLLKGESRYLSKDDLVLQLGQEKVKRFEIVERGGDDYFISHPLDSTCSSGSNGRPLEETQDKDVGLLHGQSTTDNKKSVLGPVFSEICSPEVGPVNPPSPQGPSGSTEVVQGPVSPPEVGSVNPPSPQGPLAESTDETSSTSFLKPKEDISSNLQLSVYDQIPSDVGLLAVWEEIPKWEIPIYLGVPVVQVQSLEHERIGGVKALSYWRDGKCKGSPPTWSRLLDAVECSEGPLIREELAAKVSTEKIWTRATEVVPGQVTSEMPSPEVGPVNPPSPQGPPGKEFDFEAFMNRFSGRFLKSVDSHAIVTRLEIEYIISDTLAHTIKHTTVNSGNEELLLYLRKHADADSIGKLCDVMISKDGYHVMQKLGQDMKEDLAKFTGETEH